MDEWIEIAQPEWPSLWRHFQIYFVEWQYAENCCNNSFVVYTFLIFYVKFSTHCLTFHTHWNENYISREIHQNLFLRACLTQGSKFHSSDRLRRVKMTVGQVEYLQDLSDGRLLISYFHISCIGFINVFQTSEWYIRTSDFYNPLVHHLPDGQVHSIWNFEACWQLVHIASGKY